MLFRVLVLYCADWPGSRLLGRRRRRLPSRWGRRQAVSFGNPGKPVALSGGVVRRLRAAVELAGAIQSLLVGESRQPIGLPPFCRLGGGCSSGCWSSTAATWR